MAGSAGSSDAPDDAVRSSFADDPHFAAILPKFVEHVRRLRSELERLGRERNWTELREVAHQLKGTGGSYGFAELSTRAAALEAAALEAATEADGAARALGALAAVTEYMGRIVA